MAEIWNAIKPVVLGTILPGLLLLIWEWFMGKQKKLPGVNSTISLGGLIVRAAIAKGASLIGGKKQ